MARGQGKGYHNDTHPVAHASLPVLIGPMDATGFSP